MKGRRSVGAMERGQGSLAGVSCLDPSIGKSILALSLLLFVSLTASAQYNIKKLMEEGRNTLNAGYYVASMQIFNRVVSLKPRLYEAWYLMALSKYHLEDFTGTQEDCTEAIKLNPYVPEIFDLRAMAYIKMEQYDSAAVDYTHAIDLQPDNREYWYNRAYSYYQSGKQTLALQQLDYITGRWRDFQHAAALLREVKNNRRPTPSSQGKWVHTLSFQRKTLPLLSKKQPREAASQ